MAVAIPATPLADLHGKLSQTDKIVFRVRDGILQAYAIKNPYSGKPSEAQAQRRNTFKNLNQQAKAIYADPEQRAIWQERFVAYTSTREYKKQLARYIAEKRAPSRFPAIPVPQSERTPKPPTTLYGFILSTLSHET